MTILNDQDGENRLITEINMTPLIDVMLVLLIVFMVTLPVLHHAVKLELPRATSTPLAETQKPVEVAIDSAGIMHWNGVVIDAAGLDADLAQAAAQPEPPALQLYADRAVRYEAVANVLSAAQRSGLTKIQFVTDVSGRSQ
jgi:biopolymer transport protein ExbD